MARKDGGMNGQWTWTTTSAVVRVLDDSRAARRRLGKARIRARKRALEASRKVAVMAAFLARIPIAALARA